MNILLINHYAGNPQLGMEFRPYYLGREWARTGNRVIIVGGSYSHLRKQQPTVDKETVDGTEYRWIPLKPYKGNGLGRIRSMFDFVRKLWFGYKKYIGDFKPDVVIASSTYPLDIYPARKIAKHYGAKLVYEVHDLWPLSPMELGGYSKNHPFIMVMQAAEDYCYRHSDKVVSLLPNALEHMVERGMNPEKFVCVPNGFDIMEWDLEGKVLPQQKLAESYPDHASLFSKLRSDGQFIIGFAGAHGIANSLYTLIDVASHLENNGVSVVLVGRGQEKANLMAYAKEKGVHNVYFLDPVEKTAIPYVLPLCDALYIGLQRQPLFRFGISPNKMFDYMMASRPVIQAIDAGNNLVEEAQCGVYVEPDNVEAIVAAVRKLVKSSKAQLDEMGDRGQRFALKNHAYPVLAQKFIDSLK